jgi:hypothetical protein
MVLELKFHGSKKDRGKQIKGIKVTNEKRGRSVTGQGKHQFRGLHD